MNRQLLAQTCHPNPKFLRLGYGSVSAQQLPIQFALPLGKLCRRNVPVFVFRLSVVRSPLKVRGQSGELGSLGIG